MKAGVDSIISQVGARRSEADEVRVLVFTAPALSVELEVMPGHMVGQIIPPGPAKIRVEAADGCTIGVEADDAGFFHVPAMPPGPVRLRCDALSGRLVTEWIRL